MDDTTKTVEAATKTTQDTVKEVSQFTTYLQNHIPDFISFGIKVVFALVFFFIGRNEEYGSDAMRILNDIQEMIEAKSYSVKTVAASIKNLAQLEKLAAMKIDYAAIPYALYMKSLQHPLTDSGAQTFADDFYQNACNH